LERKAVSGIMLTLLLTGMLTLVATSDIETVYAYTPPGGWPEGQPYFTLHAVLGNDPHEGEYSGYHDVMDAIRTELAKIGINLEFHFFNEWIIFDIQWFTFWDRPGPPPGWDVGVGAWCADIGSLTGTARDTTAWGIPPLGRNIAPYLNLKAETLMTTAEATIDAETRRDLIWKWQELFMHDLPMIPMFYLEIHSAVAKWMRGFDPNCEPRERGHPYSQLWVNNTMLAEMGKPQRVLPWAEMQSLASTNPMFMINYAEDSVHTMTHDTLYSFHRVPFPDFYNASFYDPEEDDFWTYRYSPVPNLAVDFPIYSADWRTAYVPLRDNVDWVWPNGTNTGVRFNASDVEFTFDAVLDPATQIWGYADFSPVIDKVEYVTNATLDSLAGIIPDQADPQYNDFDPDPYYWREPYVVQFNLKKPHADFVPLLYNTWGGYILPEFVLGDIPHASLRSHETNYKYETLPGTGPWRITDWDPTDHITMEQNPHYWKTDFKPFETIDQAIVKIIVDEAAVIAALLAGDIAWGPCGIYVPTWEAWKTPGSGEYQPYLTMFKYQNPCAHPLYLNLNNPILANRYVRQAIVHAMPYETIFGIVPDWGKTAIPMKSVIMPQQFYTEPNVTGSTTLTGSTVRLFNTDDAKCPYYAQDLTKAQYYMDLYLNQTADPTGWPDGVYYGHVGDADQSGLVNFDDWWIWRVNIGTDVTTPIDIYPTWPFTLDPDFNNDGDVDLDDVWLWSVNYGTEYRFPGAR